MAAAGSNLSRLAATLLGLAALVLCAAPGATERPQLADPQAYEQPRVRELVSLVNQAADQVRRDGEAAFEDFHRPGKWLDPDEGTYLFMFDMAGNQVVNAGFPEVENVNRLDWKDAWGKPVFRLAIEKLSPDKDDLAHWWTHYLWPRPGTVQPAWKSTFMARAEAPSGVVYAVAAGIYGATPERLFVEQMVEDAIALIRKEGDDAFATISRRDGGFFFDDVFVFVLDETGVELANAAFSHLIDKNLLELPGFAGKDMIRRELEFVKRQNTGWMVGEWPRAGETEPTTEDIYLKAVRLGNRTLIVGSGIYRDR